MYSTGLDDSFGATDVSFATTQQTITSPYRQNTQPTYEDLEKEYQRLRMVNFNLKLSLMNMEEAVQELELGPEMADLVLQNAQLKAAVKTTEELLRVANEANESHRTRYLRYEAREKELEAQCLAAAAREAESATTCEAVAAEKDASIQHLLSIEADLLDKNQKLYDESDDLARQLLLDTKERTTEMDETRSLQSRFEELQALYRQSQEELATSATNLSKAEAQLHDAGKAKDLELAAEAEKCRRSGHSVRRLEDDLVEMEAEISELRRQLEDTRNANSTLSSEMDQKVERRLLAREKESTLRWQAEITALEERLEQTEESQRLSEVQDRRREELLTEYQTSLTDMEAEAEQLRQSLDAMNDSIASYVQRIRELEFDDERKEQDLANRAEETSCLEAALLRAQQNEVDMKAECDAFETQAADLRAQLDQMQMSLTAAQSASQTSPVRFTTIEDEDEDEGEEGEVWAGVDDEAREELLRRPTIPVTDGMHTEAAKKASSMKSPRKVSAASSGSSLDSPKLQSYSFPASVASLDIEGVQERKPSKLLEKRRASRADALLALQDSTRTEPEQQIDARPARGLDCPPSPLAAAISRSASGLPNARQCDTNISFGKTTSSISVTTGRQRSDPHRMAVTPQARAPPRSSAHFNSAYDVSPKRSGPLSPLMRQLTRTLSGSSSKAATPRATTPRATTPRAATPRATTPRATTPRAATPRATTPRSCSPCASTRSLLRVSSAISPKSSRELATSPLQRARTPLVARQESFRQLKSQTPRAQTPHPPTPVALHGVQGAPLSPLLRRVESLRRGTPPPSQPPTPQRHSPRQTNSFATSPHVAYTETAAVATSPASFMDTSPSTPSPRHLNTATSPLREIEYNYITTATSPFAGPDVDDALSVGVSESWDARGTPEATTPRNRAERMEDAMKAMSRTLSPLVLPQAPPLRRTLSARNSPSHQADEGVRTLSPKVTPFTTARTLSPYATSVAPLEPVSPLSRGASFVSPRSDTELRQHIEENDLLRAQVAELEKGLQVLDVNFADAAEREAAANTQLVDYKQVSLEMLSSLYLGGQGVQEELSHADVLQAMGSAGRAVVGLRDLVAQSGVKMDAIAETLSGVAGALQGYARRVAAMQKAVIVAVKGRRKEALQVRNSIARVEAGQQAEMKKRLQSEDTKLKLEFEVERLRTSLAVTQQTCEQQASDLETRRADLCVALDKAANLEIKLQSSASDLSKAESSSQHYAQDVAAKKHLLTVLTQRCDTAESAVSTNIDAKMTTLSDTVANSLFSLRDFIDECGWGRQTLGMSSAFLESISGCATRCHQVMSEIHALGKHAEADMSGYARARDISPVRRRGGSQESALSPASRPCVHTAIARHETKTVEMMVERLESLAETLQYHGQQRQLSLKNILQRIAQLEEVVLRQLSTVKQVVGSASTHMTNVSNVIMEESPVASLNQKLSRKIERDDTWPTFSPLPPTGGVSPVHRHIESLCHTEDTKLSRLLGQANAAFESVRPVLKSVSSQ